MQTVTVSGHVTPALSYAASRSTANASVRPFSDERDQPAGAVRPLQLRVQAIEHDNWRRCESPNTALCVIPGVAMCDGATTSHDHFP